MWKPKKGNAAIYAWAYAALLPVANEKGYALAVHGTLTRDADFIAVPWIEEAADPEVLVDACAAALGWMKRDDQGNPGNKPHGRLSYNIIDPESFGDHSRWIDLAVFPVPTRRIEP